LSQLRMYISISPDLHRNEFKEYRGAIACFVCGTVLTASGVPRNVNEPGYGETQESASVW
jgi:hypothetical protein